MKSQHRPRRSRRLPRGSLLIALMILSLTVAAGLAYQAIDSARSHRAAAERALDDYAGIAAWEFGRRARASLAGDLWSTFRTVRELGPIDGARDARALRLPGPERIARAHENADCGCPRSAAPDLYFRVDLANGDVSTWPSAITREREEELLSRIRRWVADEAPGRTLDAPSPWLLSPTPGGMPGVLALMPVLDGEGTTVAAYGYRTDLTAFEALFARSCADRPLLPGSLAGGLPNDSLLSIRVLTPGGEQMYASPVPYPDVYSAEDTLPPALGGLIVRAAVRPEAASTLVIGGMPSARLPLILGLLLIAAGIGAAVVVQVRREREFDRRRDDFVSGVSHELRTPLAQIRLFAELLDEGRLRDEGERARSARVIHQEARRLTHLVENVLRFLRDRRDRIRLAIETVDVAGLLEETVEFFRPLAASRGVRLEASAPPGLTIAADRTALRQTLLNLLDNGVKYGPAGGRLEVSAVVREGGGVRIAVEDEGPGVPERDREVIWEPYRRLERDGRGPTGGSGIGLAVVRALAEAHGGTARVEGAPGGGARFIIELPSRSDARVATHAPAPAGVAATPWERAPDTDPVVDADRASDADRAPGADRAETGEGAVP